MPRSTEFIKSRSAQVNKTSEFAHSLHTICAKKLRQPSENEQLRTAVFFFGRSAEITGAVPFPEPFSTEVLLSLFLKKAASASDPKMRLHQDRELGI